MIKCRGNPAIDGKHCGCKNETCPICGAPVCCWCGEIQQNLIKEPCKECKEEIESNERYDDQTSRML